VSKAGAKFDPNKTKWFQQQYLRALSDEQLAATLISQHNLTIAPERLAIICGLMKERATFAQDILSEGAYLLDTPSTFDAETIRKKWKPETTAFMQEWKQILTDLADFSAASIENAFKAFLEAKQVGIGAVLLPYRLTLTGVGAGPGMFDVSAFLGKEEVLSRIDQGLKAIESILNETAN
jgi:glutamyl-tRNA synthetase